MKAKKWLILGATCVAGGFMILALLTARPPANPAVDPSRTVETRMEVPPHVQATLRRACFDCHSNNTRWPWYSQIPPGVWMISADVRRARGTMNFSDWPDSMAPGNKAPGLLLAVCAGLRAQRMPPERYLKLHPDARLSQAEIDSVCDWTRTQVVKIAAAKRRLRQSAHSE